MNVGSSTLKWSLLDTESGEPLSSDSLSLDASESTADGRAFGAAVEKLPEADAIAHRIVHGGLVFREAMRVDPHVRAELQKLVPLDPLHAEPALATIDAASKRWPGIPQFLAFDTGFHSTLPPEAATYPIPRTWTERFGIRRFGFHGISVSYASRRAAELLGRPIARLVVIHLGSGCSITAVKAGVSIDTTMGFSPLDGVMMATRAGAVDPGIALYVAKEHKIRGDAFEAAISRHSGLLGVSGRSGDLRVVRAAADNGSPESKLACSQFSWSVRRWLGAMVGSLGGADAMVFTGGIGEHDAIVRREVIEPFAFVDARLDDAANRACSPDCVISSAASKVAVLVITAREDLEILRAVKPLMSQSA